MLIRLVEAALRDTLLTCGKYHAISTGRPGGRESFPAKGHDILPYGSALFGITSAKQAINGNQAGQVVPSNDDMSYPPPWRGSGPRSCVSLVPIAAAIRALSLESYARRPGHRRLVAPSAVHRQQRGGRNAGIAHVVMVSRGTAIAAASRGTDLTTCCAASLAICRWAAARAALSAAAS